MKRKNLRYGAAFASRSGEGMAKVSGQRYALREGTLMLIERGDRHEIRNIGRDLLRTLNI